MSAAAFQSISIRHLRYLHEVIVLPRAVYGIVWTSAIIAGASVIGETFISRNSTISTFREEISRIKPLKSAPLVSGSASKSVALQPALAQTGANDAVAAFSLVAEIKTRALQNHIELTSVEILGSEAAMGVVKFKVYVDLTSNFANVLKFLCVLVGPGTGHFLERIDIRGSREPSKEGAPMCISSFIIFGLAPISVGERE